MIYDKRQINNRRKESNITKVALITFIMLLAIPFAFSQAYVNQTYEVYAVITEGGLYYDADSANITIYYPDNTIFINNEPMIKFSIGKFIYSFVPDTVGNWFMTATFYNDTGSAVATNAEDVYVVDALNPLTQEELNMTFEIWIIFFIGLSLLVIAKYIKNLIFIFASGVWFIAAGASGITFLNSTIPEIAFMFILGLGIVYHGISEYIASTEAKGDFKEE